MTSFMGTRLFFWFMFIVSGWFFPWTCEIAIDDSAAPLETYQARLPGLLFLASQQRF